MGKNAPGSVLEVAIAPRTLLMSIGLLLLLWTLFLIREALLVLFVAGLLATALYPGVSWLKKRHFPRRFSIGMFYLLFIVLAAGILILMTNLIIDQGQQFADRFPFYLDSAMRFLSQHRLLRAEDGALSLFARYFGSLAAEAVGFILARLNYLLVLVQGLISLVTVLVFAFFLLVDTPYFESALLRFIHPSKQEKTAILMRTLTRKVGYYIRGQLSVMAITGSLTWLGLSLIGVNYAFILGLLVFLLDIIPIVGPILATFFGVLVALGQEPRLVLWALLVYFTVQQLESFLLTPAILGRSAGIHPFWVLLSILIGGILFGVVGVLLAVPTAIAIGLLIEEFHLQERALQANQSPSEYSEDRE